MSLDLAAMAKETAERMNKVAKQAYAPVKIIECWMCLGDGYDDDGSRCFNCAGRGRVATDPDFEI